MFLQLKISVRCFKGSAYGMSNVGSAFAQCWRWGMLHWTHMVCVYQVDLWFIPIPFLSHCKPEPSQIRVHAKESEFYSWNFSHVVFKGVLRPPIGIVGLKPHFATGGFFYFISLAPGFRYYTYLHVLLSFLSFSFKVFFGFEGVFLHGPR